MIPTKTFALLAVTLLAAGALAGCADNAGGPEDEHPTTTPTTGARTQQALSGEFGITGSSTVYPVGQAWAEEFMLMHPQVDISYNVVGTGGGFQAFCRGEFPLTGASRPIKPSETSACANNSITPYEVQIAIDGLAIVVSKQNTFLNNITVDELNRIWTANASKQVNRWNQLRPEWPDQPIALYGPGTNSGTFDYFVEVIIHPKDGASTKGRSDYTPSEDDNVLVQGIASSQYALGYFGLAYVHENADKIRAVPVDAGKGAGAVEPTNANVADGKYAPLARPVYYYAAGKPAGNIDAFLDYGRSDEGQDIVEEVGYIKLPAAKLLEMRAKLA